MSCNISIFAKRAFLNVCTGKAFDPSDYHGRGHLLRVSSMIRADQIADYIGAKLNPTEGYNNDICIYVKPRVESNDDFTFEGKPYLDIVDGWNLIPMLKKHPEVLVIACSKRDVITVGEQIPNKIIFIPQHHCNYDREKRTRTEIKTVGVIGTEDAFPYLPIELEGELQKRGMNLLKFSKFFCRQDIINFYKQIDVQIVWRPYRKRLANPLKIVNASSFGIPTIALDEPYFKEVETCYFPVKRLSEFLFHLDWLKANPQAYEEDSKKCLEKSEEYHIEKVANLYLSLS